MVLETGGSALQIFWKVETILSWTKDLDESYGLDVLYMDYRKVFDIIGN